MTSIVRRRERNDSGEYSDASQETEKHNSVEDGAPPDSDYDDSRDSVSDLSEKDPDSQEAERRVDDDEDRSNPQYIPKRGTFYEHDDRTAAGEEESTNTTASDTTVEKKEVCADAPAERRRPPRKSEINDKWSHDKYNENEQVPKSRDELVSIYGYDIRNEDAPPHARRNRRYGRGPNKYTRTWEDEAAYKRQAAAATTPRKPPGLEEFPELEHDSRRISKKRPPRPRSKSQPTSNESLENGTSNLRRNASIKSPKPAPANRGAPKQPPKVNTTGKVPAKNAEVRNKVVGANENMPPIEKLTITGNVANVSGPPQRKVNASFAQQRPVPTIQGKKPTPQPPQQQSQNNSVQPSPAPAHSKQPAGNAQPAPAASGTEGRGGTKRYSSLRQRPLAETYSPQQQQPQQQQPQQQQQHQQQQPQQPQQLRQYAEYAAGSQPSSVQGHQPPAAMHPQQQIMHQQVHRNQAVVPPQLGPSPPHPATPHAQQVRLGMMEQQQLVSHQHHQMHNMPPPPQPHNIAQPLPPSQGYAPPAMMPAQYMQTGGMTYYSPVEQEPPAVAIPRSHRRPTAAIPIVRPSQPDRAPNSTEKDNIDRIVENMFVRKPWPATTSADSKDKPASETRSSQEPASKESSQPNSLTSSSISTDSRPSAERTDPISEVKTEELQADEEISRTSEEKEVAPIEVETVPESIPTDA